MLVHNLDGGDSCWVWLGLSAVLPVRCPEIRDAGVLMYMSNVNLAGT